MTAEVAVMNKSGVALAADSASSIITSAGTKTYNANKLFMLSKYKPIGIMVYGNAEMMNIPWETIIKIYRKDLGDNSFKTLPGYCTHFINFLSNNTYLFPPDRQEEYVYFITYRCFSLIKRRVDKNVETVIHKGTKISETEIGRITSRTIMNAFKIIDSRPRIPTLPTTFEKEVLSKYFKIIEQAIDDVFKKHKLSEASRKRLRRVSIGLFVKDVTTLRDQYKRRLVGYSGIVIAGFGDDDLYPAIVSYAVEGVVNDTLKYSDDRKVDITSQMPAAVVPFAQDEMVVSFMEGIAPNYKDALSGYLGTLFEQFPKEIVKKLKKLNVREKQALINELKSAGANLTSTFWKGITEWANKNNIIPVLDTVEVLPIDELARMAESLVNLTSFKRRVTPVVETVSGPIDVAVISKGDGFIWIQRKHYFEKVENPHFLENYYR